MSSELVSIVYDGDVATLTLDDPDWMNVLSAEMLTGIRDGCTGAEENGARCLVVEGAGRAFSVGGDIEQMREYLNSDISVSEQMREFRETLCRKIERFAKTPIPTVAKVDGIAVGAGANLAIACDIQLASDESSIGFGFRQVGLSVDAGTSYFPHTSSARTSQRN